MNMIKQTATVLLFCIGLTLISCKETTTFTKVFENNTQDTVTVSFKSISAYNYSNSFEVLPGKSEDFYIRDEVGEHPNNYSCMDDLERLTLTFSSGRTFKKDLNDDNTWVLSSSGSKDLEEKCILIINEEYLE